jgi:hypothetical protein
MLTIDASRTTISWAMAITISARQRFGSSWFWVLAELATDMVLLEIGKLFFEECFGNSQLSHIVLWKRNLFGSLGVLSLRALSA